jgi:hypothetical protein
MAIASLFDIFFVNKTFFMCSRINNYAKVLLKNFFIVQGTLQFVCVS